MNLQRRFGVFYVARRDLVQDGFRFVLKSLEFVGQEVKFEFALNRFKYVGTSPAFDEMSEAEGIPRYEILVQGPLEDGVPVREMRMDGEVF